MKIAKFYILTCLINLFFLSIIHESGHILFCWLVGGKTLSVGYQDNIGALYVENQYPNIFTRGIGALGGSLFDCCIVLSLLFIIQITKKGKKLSLGLILTIWCESCYWILSILMQFGDGWNTSQALGINSLFILMISLFICILSYIVSMKITFKILDQLRDVV